MAETLTEKELKWLDKNRRVQPKLLVVGVVLLLLGGFYSIWASHRLISQWDGKASDDAFDGPIAQLETLFARKPEISTTPKTASEAQTERALNQVSAYFGCLLAFLLRFIFGNVFLVGGLIFTTASMQARQFLIIINKLKPPDNPSA